MGRKRKPPAIPALPPRWRQSAACLDHDLDLFFPPGHQGANAVLEQAAKAICGTCPVQPQCLDYALATRQAGIWGGATEDERQLMRRRKREVRVVA